MSPQSDLKPASERILALAQARNLNEAEITAEGETMAFLVSGTRCGQLRDQDTLVLHCPEEQRAMLVEISPEIYLAPAETSGSKALLIRLSKIGDEELSLRLEDAWTFCRSA